MAFLGILPKAPLVIATVLETKALNAADEAETLAKKTNNPIDNAKANDLRAKAARSNRRRREDRTDDEGEG